MGAGRLDPRRAVELLGPPYGSGYLLGPTLVLTAAHLLPGGEGSAVTIRWQDDEGHPVELPARVLWVGPRWAAEGSASHDVALVQLTQDLPTERSLPEVEFGELPGGSAGEVAFELYGWPRWAQTGGPGGQRPGGRLVPGRIWLADRSPDDLIVLEPTRVGTEGLPPVGGSDWEGMSGAAVVCDGCVVGVQRHHQNPRRARSLEAVRLSAFAGDPGFVDALRRAGTTARWRRLSAAGEQRPAGATAFPRPPQTFVAHPYTLLADRFLGRTAELAELDSWVNGQGAAESAPEGSPEAVYCLVAIGGMGKTALAWRWFSASPAAASQRWAGRIWWSFYEADASLEQFVVDALCYVTGQAPDQVRREDPARRAVTLLQILDREPFLIGLDGLERALVAYASPGSLSLAEREQHARQPQDSAGTGPRHLDQPAGPVPDQVPDEAGARLARSMADPLADAFLRRLPALRSSRVLVSTRLFPTAFEDHLGDPAPGVRRRALEGLDARSAAALVARGGIRTGRDELLDDLAAVEYHPLVMQVLVADVARFRPAPGDYLRWRARHPDFSPTSLGLVQRRSHILEVALRGLTAAELDVMSVISALSGPAPYEWLRSILVERGTVRGDDDLSAHLSELDDRGIVGWDRVHNRYDMHPVIRGVALDRLRSTTTGGRDVYTSLRRHFEAVPVPTRITGWSDVVPLAELFLATVHAGLPDEALTIYRERLRRPLRMLGQAPRAVELLSAFVDPSQATPTVHLPRIDQQAFVLNELALAHLWLGEPGRAAGLLEAVRGLVSQGAADPTNGLVAMCNLADAHLFSGQVEQARALATEALDTAVQLNRTALTALALQLLGRCLSLTGGRAVVPAFGLMGRGEQAVVPVTEAGAPPRQWDAERCLSEACRLLDSVTDPHPAELAAAHAYLAEYRLEQQAGRDAGQAAADLRAAQEFAARAGSEPIDVWLARLTLALRVEQGETDPQLAVALRELAARARRAGLATEAQAATLLLCRVMVRSPDAADTRASWEPLLTDLADAAERGPLPALAEQVRGLQAEAASGPSAQTPERAGGVPG